MVVALAVLCVAGLTGCGSPAPSALRNAPVHAFLQSTGRRPTTHLPIRVDGMRIRPFLPPYYRPAVGGGAMFIEVLSVPGVPEDLSPYLETPRGRVLFLLPISRTAADLSRALPRFGLSPADRRRVSAVLGDPAVRTSLGDVIGLGVAPAAPSSLTPSMRSRLDGAAATAVSILRLPASAHPSPTFSRLTLTTVFVGPGGVIGARTSRLPASPPPPVL